MFPKKSVIPMSETVDLDIRQNELEIFMRVGVILNSGDLDEI